MWFSLQSVADSTLRWHQSVMVWDPACVCLALSTAMHVLVWITWADHVLDIRDLYNLCCRLLWLFVDQTAFRSDKPGGYLGALFNTKKKVALLKACFYISGHRYQCKKVRSCKL